MPTPSPAHPGAYVVEERSGVRTITGVATSVTAFVGRALRGDVDTAVTVHSWAEFERVFGGLWTESTLGYAVNAFYRLGGSTAIIVRVHSDKAGDRATLALGTGTKELTLQARSPGTWGAKVKGEIDLDTRPRPDGTNDPKLFNLKVTDSGTGRVELFGNVSIEATAARVVDKVLASDSTLVEMTGSLPGVNPAAVASTDAAGGTNDGDPVAKEHYSEAVGMHDAKEGIYALENADLINLIVVPPYTANGDIDTEVLTKAVAYATERDAIMLVDPPGGWTTKAAAVAGAAAFTRSKNAAAYFPKVSLYRGTQWVVFESNDVPLWAQIRLDIGAFMINLFRQGAFAGTTPKEAYFIKCDDETTTPDDVNLGIVNIRVGFAPLRPDEFVVLHLQQMAGQAGGA